MFVKKSEYEAKVAELVQSKERVAALEGQLAEAKKGENTEALTALQSEKETLTEKVAQLTGNVETLTSQVEELNTANTELTTKVNTLESEKKELTTEVEILRELPGAQTATSVSKTENNAGASMSALDQVNEAIKTSDDINEKLAMISKLGI